MAVDSFTYFYEREPPRDCRGAQSHDGAGNPAVAEELSQEAFARAWRHAATYDPRRARRALDQDARSAAIAGEAGERDVRPEGR